MDMDEKKYKILYFLDYGKSFGGAANTLFWQAVLMKQMGHKVVIFFSDYFGSGMKEEYGRAYLNPGIEYKWSTYQISSQPEDVDIVCMDENYEKMKEAVALYKPDILHSVQINPCVELVARELKIPHIMNVYPLIPEFFSINYMDVFPHYHLCDSWYYAKKWEHYLKTDSTCIRTVVNARKKRKNLFPSKMPRFICVGSIYKEKNQLAVIKGFHKALGQGLHGKLTLCGYADGGYGSECVRYIEEHDLQENVIVKGFCADMYGEYSQNDVLICGSTRESYPNAISEALANGLVVISTPVGGVPEVIKDGKNGYLTRNHTEDALCEKIIQLLADIRSGVIKRILEEAEKTYMENHSPQKIKEQLNRYYQYVLEDFGERNSAGHIEELTGISEVRARFGAMLACYKKSAARFTDTDKIAQKLWYIFHIKYRIDEAVARKKEFYIWGTGKYGVVAKELVETFMPEVQIKGFLDSKRKGTFFDYEIYSPEKTLQKVNVVIFIAAANGQNEMLEEMSRNNRVYNKDYFILAGRRW